MEQLRGWGKLEIPEKTQLPAASSGTIPTCENPGATPLGIDPGSLRWEVRSLTATSPWPLISAGMQGRGKWEIPEKTRRPAASSGTIPTYENPGVTRPEIEPGSPLWEAGRLTVHHRCPFFSKLGDLAILDYGYFLLSYIFMWPPPVCKNIRNLFAAHGEVPG
ncbi:hypothetical protein PR048_027530 [Dryococelus australis]|uniref:Uncharacterized protein n=1 Tax=Dryococelus australis TaxID=614101 RepID=A0ABQ9GGS4_9NEOP|nr:hypothetical protein PR048_027530 [Dryococelus australis]